jgi:hypothetical protein
MAFWGTAISMNDTYADIFGSFMEMYNDGMQVKDISAKLIADNQDLINDGEEKHNFWFALARAQWECKESDPKVLETVKTIVESGADIELWQFLKADEGEIAVRKQVLARFYAELQTEKFKPRERKKKKEQL